MKKIKMQLIEELDYEEVNKEKSKERKRLKKSLEKLKKEEEPKEEKIPKSKLEAILFEKNLTQGDLRRLIKNNSGFMIGRDRISKICTGKTKTYNLMTAVMISEALQVKVDDIIEIKNIKKENSKK